MVQEVKILKNWVTPFDELNTRASDARGLADLLEAEPDPAMESELEGEVARLDEGMRAIELQAMLQGPDDGRDAILTIHPGAGGTESQDWAEMLFRMYTRWAERHGYTVDVLDLQPGDEAGIKDATLEITGEYAYGYLKAESGVHRLVRISPYDAQARRHTSFASVFVYPDGRRHHRGRHARRGHQMDVYRASGAGGQHVNKTESAVRITHLPTGIVVQSQAERSQRKNRRLAMRMLEARLFAQPGAGGGEGQARGDEEGHRFGSQIRSYVLQPYTMVNDHRTELKMTDVQAVLDGDLDPFIDAYLKQYGSKAA